MKFSENENTELKEIFTPTIKKEVVAFANTNGGKIYIGISDTGKIIGVDNADQVMQQVSSSLKDSILPDIIMFSNIELLNIKGKKIVKITVEQGTKKPYYLANKGIRPSGVYVRSGTTSSPATEESIRRMIKETDGESFESNRSVMQKLNFNSLSKELAKRNLSFTEIQMKNLGIMTEDKIYTNMGLLVSDQCTHSIKLAIFQGTDKLVFRDRKEFSGSLFLQLTETYKLIDFYNGTKANFQDLIRTDIRDYPKDAIREALLNAIVHRDYSFSGSTLINIYSDRLEIISLGGLVPGLSLEAAMMGASQTRNKNLAALFYRLKLIEAYGTGISKIISSYDNTNLKPKFESVEGAFRVVLPKINDNKKPDNNSNLDTLSEMYSPMISLLENQKEFIRKDVEKAMGVKSTQAIKIINDLLKKGIITKTGRGRSLKYLRK